jgi:hypothetical protein
MKVQLFFRFPFIDFSTEAKKVLELKKQIDTTDKAIDVMIYELYGLIDK